MRTLSRLVFAGALALVGGVAHADKLHLLNVSYDPTRQLYEQLNPLFIAEWRKASPSDQLIIDQSHGGSGAQSRAIHDGLEADVATLALSYDIDVLAQAKLLSPDWQKRLPNNATPYTSTIVFLVRMGNPWKVKDWPDLVKPGIQVVTPNPKTSGGARWSYLAAWAYAEHALGGNADKAKAFVADLYKHVPVLDTGARGSTMTFTQRGVGDVLLSWENEARQALDDAPGKYEIVYPPVSILAEPPVAVVDKNVDKHKTRKVAEAYLNFLYTKPAQEVEAKNWYRPRDPQVAAAYASKFPQLKFYTLDADFGGWTKAQKTHFDDGGVFDQIFKPGK